MLAAIFFRPLIGLWTGGTLERGLIGFILLCNMHQSWLRGLNQFTTITFFCLSFFSRENAPILAVESGQPTDLDGSWRWRIAGRYGRDARLVRHAVLARLHVYNERCGHFDSISGSDGQKDSLPRGSAGRHFSCHWRRGRRRRRIWTKTATFNRCNDYNITFRVDCAILVSLLIDRPSVVIKGRPAVRTIGFLREGESEASVDK